MKARNNFFCVYQRRVETFVEFLESGRFDKLTIDADQSDKLVKLLDAFVIKLEGGTDLDLEVLEAPPTTSAPAESAAKAPVKREKEKLPDTLEEEGEETEDKTEVDDSKPKGSPDAEAGQILDEVSGEEGKKGNENLHPLRGTYMNVFLQIVPENKRKRSDFESDQSGSDWEADESSRASRSAAEAKATGEDSLASPSGPDAGKDPEDKKESMDEDKNGTAAASGASGAKPRELHRTASIFLRNLAPTITKQEVEAVSLPSFDFALSGLIFFNFEFDRCASGIRASCVRPLQIRKPNAAGSAVDGSLLSATLISRKFAGTSTTFA